MPQEAMSSAHVDVPNIESYLSELSQLEHRLHNIYSKSGDHMSDEEWNFRYRAAVLSCAIGSEYRRCGNRELPEAMMQRAEVLLSAGGSRLFTMEASRLRAQIMSQRAAVASQIGHNRGCLVGSLQASMASLEGELRGSHPAHQALKAMSQQDHKMTNPKYSPKKGMPKFGPVQASD